MMHVCSEDNLFGCLHLLPSPRQSVVVHHYVPQAARLTSFWIFSYDLLTCLRKTEIINMCSCTQTYGTWVLMSALWVLYVLDKKLNFTITIPLESFSVKFSEIATDKLHFWTLFFPVLRVPQGSLPNVKCFNSTAMYMRSQFKVSEFIADRRKLNGMIIKTSDIFFMTRAVEGTFVLFRFVNTKMGK